MGQIEDFAKSELPAVQEMLTLDRLMITHVSLSSQIPGTNAACRSHSLTLSMQDLCKCLE
jgi:hypothetical protein